MNMGQELNHLKWRITNIEIGETKIEEYFYTIHEFEAFLLGYFYGLNDKHDLKKALEQFK